MAENDYHYYRIRWISKYTDISGKKTRTPSYFADIRIREGAIGSYDDENERMAELIGQAKLGIKQFANGILFDTAEHISYADLYQVKIEKILCARDIGASVFKAGLTYPAENTRFGLGTLPADRIIGDTIYIREAHYRDDLSQELSRLTIEPINTSEFQDDEDKCFPVFGIISIVDGNDQFAFMDPMFNRIIANDIDNQFITKR